MALIDNFHQLLFDLLSLNVLIFKVFNIMTFLFPHPLFKFFLVFIFFGKTILCFKYVFIFFFWWTTEVVLVFNSYGMIELLLRFNLNYWISVNAYNRLGIFLIKSTLNQLLVCISKFQFILLRRYNTFHLIIFCCLSDFVFELNIFIYSQFQSLSYIRSFYLLQFFMFIILRKVFFKLILESLHSFESVYQYF